MEVLVSSLQCLATGHEESKYLKVTPGEVHMGYILKKIFTVCSQVQKQAPQGSGVLPARN